MSVSSVIFLFLVGDFRLAVDPFDEIVVVGDVLSAVVCPFDKLEDLVLDVRFERMVVGLGPVFLCERYTHGIFFAKHRLHEGSFLSHFNFLSLQDKHAILVLTRPLKCACGVPLPAFGSMLWNSVFIVGTVMFFSLCCSLIGSANLCKLSITDYEVNRNAVKQ